MQPEPEPIQAALLRQQEAPGPRIVRVVGAGAYDAAARWVEQHGAEVEVPFPFLPETPNGSVWLHDAPGSRYLADILAAHCELEGLAWTLLLTGRALDGAHPDQGEMVEVRSSAPGEAVPTVIALEVPDALEASIAMHLDVGDLAEAHALYEVWIDQEGGPTTLDWVELVRLIHVSRSGEVEERATHLPGRSRCPAQVLLAMAEAAMDLGADRSRFYLDALDAHPLTPRQAADLAFFRALGERDLDAVRAAEPGSTRLKILRRKIQRSVGDVVQAARPPGRFAAAMEVFEDGPIEALLAAGDLTHAVRIARSEGRQVGGVYLHDSAEVGDRLQQARSALDADDFDSAERILGEIEKHLLAQRTSRVFYWSLYAAVVAAQRANVGRLHALEARLHGFTEQMWSSPELVQALVPRVQPPDPWCRVTLLRLIEATGNEQVEVLERAFAALPERPIVLGPYVLEQTIASGGMGTVWRGQHRLTERPVAVKVLDRATPEAVELFRAEIDVVARFDHPMIVSVLDLLEVDERTAQQSGGALRSGQPALVMELVDNGTLADHLGELAWEDIRDVLLGTLEALAYAHAHGVVHRDLKPQNILVGERNALRLADFGLAELGAGRVAGTPTYMAPEQFRPGPVGPGADVYAAGCIAWTLACGLPPFIGSAEQLARAHNAAPVPPFEPMLALPAGFETWLRRCLQKDPSARFPSAAAAAEALLAIEEEPRELPGREPELMPAPRSSTTFVLQTLLDLPDHVFEPRDEGTATRRLHDIFEERASWRPRIPTDRLLHKGEPPVLFQRDAQRALWSALMTALGGRTKRVSLFGRGAESILRWLRRRARIAGLIVHEQPAPGHVSIVDATDLDPASLPRRGSERWVLVWRDRQVAGAQRIELRPFEPGAIWWIIYSRILLHPQTACRVAIEAAGSPDVAFALVDDFLENPGVEMTPRGLKLIRTPEEPGPRALACWRRFIGDARPERLHLAQLIAIKPFAAAGGFLRDAAHEDDPDLRSLAIDSNDAWKMPPALRKAVLETLDAEQTRQLHRLAAEREHQPAARVVHACLADPTLENTVALVDVLRDQRLPTALLELAQVQINCHLLEAPELRARWRLGQLPDALLSKHMADADPLIADLARLEAYERLLPWSDEVAAAVERDLLRDRRPVLTIRLVHALSDRLSRLGREEHGRRVVERVGEALEGHPEHRPHLYGWARARCREGEEAVAAYQAALTGAPPVVATSLHIDLADELIQLERYAEALVHLDHSRGTWSLAADYNRALALLALGRDDEARRLTFRLTSIAMGEARPSLFVGLCYAELYLHLDEPTPMWEALFELQIPIRDQLMQRVLQRRLTEVPRTARAARLARALE